MCQRNGMTDHLLPTKILYVIDQTFIQLQSIEWQLVQAVIDE